MNDEDELTIEGWLFSGMGKYPQPPEHRPPFNPMNDYISDWAQLDIAGDNDIILTIQRFADNCGKVRIVAKEGQLIIEEISL